MVVIGEPGVGKIMLLRYLLNNITSNYQIAFLLTPCLSPIELLQVILEDLDINYNKSFKEFLIRHFRDYLISLVLKGQQLLLIIDEAQNLPEDTFEELRLLSNLEIENRKLLQIILAGQSLLESKLLSLKLTQLVQRITVWKKLEPLSKEENQKIYYSSFILSRWI